MWRFIPCLLLLLAGCAGAEDTVVHIPPHVPAPGPSALAISPPVDVAVAAFQETGGIGVLPGRIGERKTLSNLSMGEVTIDPPPGALLRDAFVRELRAAGQRIVSSGGEATLGGQVRQFTLRTDVTALYWDVVVDAAVDTTVQRAGRTGGGSFTAHCQERTYGWPGSEITARVVATCVDDLARQFRDNADVARVLSGR